MGRSPKNSIVKRIYDGMEMLAKEPSAPKRRELKSMNTFLEWVDNFLSTGELVGFDEFSTRINYRKTTYRPRLAT